MTNFDSPQNVVLPVVWFYLHPFAEEFLVEQFAVGHSPKPHLILYPYDPPYSPLPVMGVCVAEALVSSP